MMTKVELFSAEECDRIRDGIHELRPFWIHRDEMFRQPFFTLGFGTYDAKKDLDLYYREAPLHNLILKNQFEWAYDRLLKVLEETLGRPTFYDDQLALPGFHIFLAAKAFELPLAVVHWDMQHHYLDWAGKDVSFENTISFTAAIRLPKGGAGLNVWDLKIEEMEKLSTEECDAIFTKGPDSFIEYRAGRMLVHSGEILHQIAPMKNMTDTDERITLQGWGIRSSGGYLLYW